MAAQIIPFPKRRAFHEALAGHYSEAAGQDSQHSKCHGGSLHLVRPAKDTVIPSVTSGQQNALRIVEDVCIEHNLPHPAVHSQENRSATFWKTLPLAPSQIETPVTVAKRIANMIFPVSEPV